MDSKVLRIIFSALLALTFVAAGCGDDEGCPSGQVMCGNKCVDWLTDDDHCGQCDNICGLHADCVNGQCSCVAGYSDCSGTCVNLNFDAAHCGSCPNACAQDEVCVNGNCVTDCPAGQTKCGQECVTLSSDEAHCGACNAACRADQLCLNSACACTAGLTECNNSCVNTNNNPSYCGDCNTACLTDEACINGQCRGGGQTCADFGLTDCSGACVNTTNDEANCGDCDAACRNDQVCSNSACACTAGLTECANSCVNTDNNPSYCGDCNTACNAGESCINGQCVTGQTCEDFGLTTCGAVCADTSSDEAHCSACNAACRADQLCINSACTCTAGLTDCAGSCVNTNNNPGFCGNCNTSCQVGEVCISGQCQGAGTCADFGLTDCHGLCVDTVNDPINCGTCDNTCAFGQYCVSSVCACPAGQTFCAGGCVNTMLDEMHCGACDSPCGLNEICDNGTCAAGTVDHIAITCDDEILPTEGQTQCYATLFFAAGSGMTPVDITTDVTWLKNELDPAGDMIDSLVDGLVVLNDVVTDDEAEVYAEYVYNSITFTSNVVTIKRENRVLCGLVITPAGRTLGDGSPLRLPYLASAATQLRWQLFAVGEYRNDTNCTTGGPYYHELTNPAYLTWSVQVPGVASIIEQTSPYEAYVKENYRATYPAGNLNTDVYLAYDDGTDTFSATLSLTIIPLTDTNWSIAGLPSSASLPLGISAGFTAELTFGVAAYKIDVTEAIGWPAATFTEVPVTTVLLADQGVTDGERIFQANNTTTGETDIEVAFTDAQDTPKTDTANIDIDVTDAAPVSCVITPGDSTWPAGRSDVQYSCTATMTNGAVRDITAEDFGNSWSVEYAGAAGALGTIQVYGQDDPGLYDPPSTYPTPDVGTIRYTFDPAAGDEGFCEVDLTVAERTLCGIKILSAQENERQRRMFYPNPAAGSSLNEDRVMLPNVDNWVQEFFLVGEYWNGEGTTCQVGNTFDGAIANGDATWTIVPQITDDEIFNPATFAGIGIVRASATAEDRVDEIQAMIDTTPNNCASGECMDSIWVDACGTPAVGTRRVASVFTEAAGPSYNTVATYAGDQTKRYYAIQGYAPASGTCSFTGTNPGTPWYLDESESVAWETTNAAVAEPSNTADARGDINAKAPGTVLIGANWPGAPGTPDDQLQFTVTDAVVVSIAITPLGDTDNPVEVSYAPMTPILSENAQFTATATMSDGSPDQNITDNVIWSWTGGCSVLDVSTVDAPRGLVEANGAGEGTCNLTATCAGCGVGGADVVADAETVVGAVQANVDCNLFWIQTPDRTCIHSEATNFGANMIDDGVPSTMNLYACIGFDNGARYSADLFSNDGSVSWSSNGPARVSVDSMGRISVIGNGAPVTITAAMDVCSDTIVVTPNAGYLTGLSLSNLIAVNWNNCGGTGNDACMLRWQTAQFMLTGSFQGGGTMDLTTHTGTTFAESGGALSFIAGELPGFAQAAGWTDTTPSLTSQVTASVNGQPTGVSDATATIGVYRANPTSINASVGSTLLDWSNFRNGIGGNTYFSVNASNGLFTVQLRNDAHTIMSHPQYMRTGLGEGASFNGNWYLVPREVTSAQTGLSVDVEYSYYDDANSTWDVLTDTITGITVQP